MSAGPNVVAAQEVKRRGVAAIEEKLKGGPVHVLRNNRPICVVLTEDEFAELVRDAERGWLAESLNDLREGRVRKGSVQELLDELRS